MTIVVDVRSSAGHRREQFDLPLITIGRDPSNDINFPPDDDRVVSAFHAKLADEDGAIVIEDIGSRNGTYVNGQKILGRTIVEPSSEVMLGLNGPRLRVTKSIPHTMVDVRLDEITDVGINDPPKNAVGSGTVVRLIDEALARSQKENGWLQKRTVFLQEVARLAARETRRELRIGLSVLAILFLAGFGFLLYRIARVRSEVRAIKSELVAEYGRGIDAAAAKLGEQVKEIAAREQMYQSASETLRGELAQVVAAQGTGAARVDEVMKELDESRTRYSDLVRQLETVRLQRLGSDTAAAPDAKSDALSASIVVEARKQDAILETLVPPAAGNATSEKVAQIGAQLRASDAAVAQLGAASGKLSAAQKDLVTNKAAETAAMGTAVSRNNDEGTAAVLDRLTQIDRATAPVAAVPTPIAAVAEVANPSGKVKTAFSRPYPRAALKKRVALGKFECLVSQNPWGLSREDVEKQMRAQMTTLLRDTGKFIIVDREDLAEVLNEQRLSGSGVTTGQSSAQSGQLLGAQAVIIGKITQLDEQIQQSKSSTNWGAVFSSVASVAGSYSPNTQFAQVTNKLASDPTLGTLQTTTERRNSKVTIHIDFKVLDTNTGEVLFTTQGHGVAETIEKRTAVGTAYAQSATGLLKGNDSAADGTRQALYDATFKIMEGMDSRPWQGRIMDRDGDRLLLNAGEDAGLKEGDTFQVISRGKELIDPESGRSRGFIQTPAGSVRILRVARLNSEAEVTEQTLPFKTGDDLVYLGHTRQLSAGETADSAEPERTPFKYAVISSTKAYSGPGVNYGEINLDMDAGSPVKVKLALGDWAKVVLPSGATAWMPLGALAIHEDYPTPVRQVIVATGKAVVRQAPSNRARKVDVLREGTSADVQEKLGHWYLVRLPRGATGWIPENEVRPSEAAPSAARV
jgi:curli biogenesis system outer membrane secretion channel CsgG/SH3-like domain-containing protein